MSPLHNFIYIILITSKVYDRVFIIFLFLQCPKVCGGFAENTKEIWFLLWRAYFKNYHLILKTTIYIYYTCSGQWQSGMGFKKTENPYIYTASTTIYHLFVHTILFRKPWFWCFYKSQFSSLSLQTNYPVFKKKLFTQEIVVELNCGSKCISGGQGLTINYWTLPIFFAWVK